MKLIKKFFVWGYVKFVLLPAVREAGQDPNEHYTLEVEFIPDESIAAEIEAKHSTKH